MSQESGDEIEVHAPARRRRREVRPTALLKLASCVKNSFTSLSSVQKEDLNQITDCFTVYTHTLGQFVVAGSVASSCNTLGTYTEM